MEEKKALILGENEKNTSDNMVKKRIGNIQKISSFSVHLPDIQAPKQPKQKFNKLRDSKGFSSKLFCPKKIKRLGSKVPSDPVAYILEEGREQKIKRPNPYQQSSVIVKPVHVVIKEEIVNDDNEGQKQNDMDYIEEQIEGQSDKKNAQNKDEIQKQNENQNEVKEQEQEYKIVVNFVQNSPRNQRFSHEINREKLKIEVTENQSESSADSKLSESHVKLMKNLKDRKQSSFSLFSNSSNQQKKDPNHKTKIDKKPHKIFKSHPFLERGGKSHPQKKNNSVIVLNPKKQNHSSSSYSSVYAMKKPDHSKFMKRDSAISNISLLKKQLKKSSKVV